MPKFCKFSSGTSSSVSGPEKVDTEPEVAVYCAVFTTAQGLVVLKYRRLHKSVLFRQCHDKATDEGESPVQEANADDTIYAGRGRLRLHVVHVGHSLEVYHNEVPLQQQTY